MHIEGGFFQMGKKKKNHLCLAVCLSTGQSTHCVSSALTMPSAQDVGVFPLENVLPSGSRATSMRGRPLKDREEGEL